MNSILEITLENEMDVMLAHQKMMRAAEIIGLSITTKTTFVTALSELSRVLIEHTDKGLLSVAVASDNARHKLNALLTYPVADGLIDERLFYYAKKLVPVLNFTSTAESYAINFSIGLPRSAAFGSEVLRRVRSEVRDKIISPYEGIKSKNAELSRLTEMQEEQLRYSKRLNELKSEFLSVASHEIKTPLTVLHGYVQMAAKKETLEETRKIITKIEQQLKKLNHLSVKLLDSAKTDSGKLEYDKQPMMVNAVLERLFADLVLITSSHELEMSVCDDVQLFIDPVRIEQVISNMVSNAAKYSAPGSRINISSSLNDNAELIISVKDEGFGMNSESVSRVFEKFYRDKGIANSYSGLGMGMYIANEIVSEHGGRIWVESEAGKGSTFHFSIPRAEGAA
ncbi:sensor histidine kinase [Pedobacter deserti]|uniref:sensor histidine kinase n=1 Tax=Pedobacter deserti TaxID=2817382 RepID=UPI002108B63A|nr:HAMP domain-containing sensor histidine kinase [Pedobacter sp. SYSU D00382]